jgi:DNA polymerase III epsilon subunit-like protein
MFKLSNDIIVIDLEATAGTDKDGHQTNDFIIDIGAVLLNKDMEFLGSFSETVQPEESISPFIAELTGITNEMVADRPLWSKVGQDFEDWVRQKSGNPKKARLAAWGNYFDIPLLRKSYERYKLHYPFAGTAVDVKTLAFTWLAFSGRRTDKLNLEILAKHLGIEPDGEYHRAITDAKVTALVLQEIWSQLQGVFMPSTGTDPWVNYQFSPKE